MVKFAMAAIAAATLFSLASVSSVQAQNSRSWVASNGNDGNNCLRANPCLTFNGALAKTNPGGEINVVDSGDYGAGALIDKSIVIQNDGAGTAGALAVSLVSGFTISGAGIVVTLRGLTINAVSFGAGVGGVKFLSGLALHVENCTVRNYTGNDAFGINFTPGGSGISRLFVSDTVVSRNGSSTGGGIHVRPSGSVSVNASLTRVISKYNTVGFKSDSSSTTGFTNLTINDSTATGNIVHGVWAVGGGGGTDIFLDRVIVNGNNDNGLRAQNAGARIFYSYSTITINGVGLAPLSGGQLISKGTNNNRGNFLPGAPTATQALE